MSSSESRSADPDAFDPHIYLGVLRRQWVVIVIAGALFLAVALVMTIRAPTKYRATSELLIEQPVSIRGSVDQESTLLNEEAYFESPTVQTAVDEAYDGPLDADTVDASARRGGGDVLTAGVTASDPEDAEELLDTYVATFIEIRRTNRVDEILAVTAEIERRIADLNERISEIAGPIDDPGERIEEALAGQLDPLLRQRAAFEAQAQSLNVQQELIEFGDVVVLGPADASDEPISPRPMRNLAVGLIAGLTVGFGVAGVRDWMHRSSADPTEA